MNPWEKYVVPNLISCACASKPMMKQREKVIPYAEGKVLEIGCGSGTNFSYYDPDKVEHLYALEPSGGMLKKAHRAAGALGYGNNIEFLETGAESVPLEDHSIDTVVYTFVLCTIPDWKGALAETRRLLKPGGKIIFSEHGLAPVPAGYPENCRFLFLGICRSGLTCGTLPICLSLTARPVLRPG